MIESLSKAVAVIDTKVIGASQLDLDGRRSMVRTTATNLHADALRATATGLAAAFGNQIPDVALQNEGGIRSDAIIPAGPITAADTRDIAPFSNFVVVGEVPREAFHALLEQAVDEIPWAGGQFTQVSGFTFVYNPSAPAHETDRDGDSAMAAAARLTVAEVGEFVALDGIEPESVHTSHVYVVDLLTCAR